MNKARKTPYHLIPLQFVAAMSEVMQAGLDEHPEYASGEWLEAVDDTFYEEHYSALLRHVEKADSVSTKGASSKSHWAAVACNAMMLWQWEQNKCDES